MRPANKNSRQDETYLRRDILPVIGSKELSVIHKPDLWLCIDAVRSRGHGQAARRVQSVLKRVFDYGFGTDCSQACRSLRQPVDGVCW
ncbi:phage integrase central domain-containing protein [Dyella terrae]|uniref:phage integrase central domain-containing protein n=1 Tax=Dyella terrae TaxID=522259 RepID=UPI003D18E91B